MLVVSSVITFHIIQSISHFLWDGVWSMEYEYIIEFR